MHVTPAIPWVPFWKKNTGIELMDGIQVFYEDKWIQFKGLHFILRFCSVDNKCLFYINYPNYKTIIDSVFFIITPCLWYIMFTFLVWNWYIHTAHLNSFLHPLSLSSFPPPSISWYSYNLIKLNLLLPYYISFICSLFIICL